MTIAEQMQREGEAKGREEDGASARIGVLTKLLTLKFGAEAAPHLDRLASASQQELDRWIERVLSATGVDDVFAGGGRRSQ